MSYKALKNTWNNFPSNNSSEKFFVSYAVRGPMINPSLGLRAGIPVNYPITGPVNQPSPLNTRWMYEKPWPSVQGIL